MSDDLQLIERLLSTPETAERAWREFLTRYSNLFLKIIWQFEKDRDEVMEKYLFVCERLVRNNFELLKRFPLERGLKPSDFTSWLVAVVRNLCVDAHRSSTGRRRYPKALLRMDPLDRKIFSLHYWQGYSREEISHHLNLRKNGNTGRLEKSFRRIQRIMEGRDVRRKQADPILNADRFDETEFVPGDEPDFMETELVSRWMRDLPPENRLVVRMRFWEDMNALEIARVLGIVPRHRVYTILKNSLDGLRNRVKKEQPEN